MPKLNDLINKKFGKLTVLSRNKEKQLGDIYNRVHWNCLCDCGNIVIIPAQSLVRGNTKSCGCLRKNKYDLESKNYGIGYTYNGDYFIFDKSDYNKIKAITWSAKGKYFVGWVGGKLVYLHRYIMNPEKGLVVDHINHREFDNRKSNLRICPQSNNSKNMKIKKNNVHGVPGIRYSDSTKKWSAYININYKYKHLGSFDTKEEAIQARNKAEENLYGEFSYKNSMAQGDVL